jgi:hypothetical protein
MQNRQVVISRAIILTFISVVLSGIMLVGPAKAGNSPPLKVKLGLPSAVNFAEVFNISINVTNQTNTTVNINKVAVGYALQLLRFKGPYEVNFTPQSVPAYGTLTFTVPFRIFDGAGTVVGLSVILANSAYTEDGVLGCAFGGVKVN